MRCDGYDCDDHQLPMPAGKGKIGAHLALRHCQISHPMLSCLALQHPRAPRDNLVSRGHPLRRNHPQTGILGIPRVSPCVSVAYQGYERRSIRECPVNVCNSMTRLQGDELVRLTSTMVTLIPKKVA